MATKATSYYEKMQQKPQHGFLMHTWYDRRAHILHRKKDKSIGLVRCVIKELESYDDGNVRVRVEFNENGELQNKMVSPSSVLQTQTYWLKWEDAYSSDEEEKATKPILPTTPLPYLQVSNLHDVFCGIDDATQKQGRKLEKTMEDINLHIEFIQMQKDAYQNYAFLEQQQQSQPPPDDL